MNIYQTAIARCLSIFFLLCIIAPAGELPSWVEKRPSDDRYYYGVASSTESVAKADETAVQRLLQEISSTVTVSIRDYYQEAGESSGSEGRSVYEKISTLYSASDLEDLEFTRRYYDEERRTWYSLVRLSKASLESLFRRKAENARQKSREWEAAAAAALAAGNISEALQKRVMALDEVLITQASIRQLLRAPVGGEEDVLLQEYLDAAVREMLRNLEFELLSGGGQDAMRGEAFPEAVKGRLSYRSDGDKIPAAGLGLKLSFINAEGRFFEDCIVTDSDGGFVIQVEELIAASSGSPAIRTGIDLPISEEFSGTLKSLSELLNRTVLDVAFNVAAKTSSRIFLHISEIRDDEIMKRSSSEMQLARTLITDKFRIVDKRVINLAERDALAMVIDYEDWQTFFKLVGENADMALLGSVTAEPTQDTGFGLVFASASARLSLLNLRNKQLVKSIEINDVEGDGSDAGSAMDSAVANCLQELIPKVREDLRDAFK